MARASNVKKKADSHKSETAPDMSNRPASTDPGKTKEIETESESHRIAESSALERFIQSRFGRKFLDILYETTVMIFYIGAIALLHLVLDWWLGKEAKFFNKYPISYIIDFAHIVVITRFVIEIIWDFIRELRH